MKISGIAAALVMVLGGCATTSGQADRALSPGAGYVSLGSSFAAGAGIGPLQAGTPERCGRTVNNYASQLARRLQLKLTDVSCGGARTPHILGNWDELAPQIDAVTADTQLVTITIGGNDLNYVGWLFTGACRMGVSMFPGPCREASEPSDADYEALDRSLRAIAVEVKRRAPRARLVFVQYVSLISETGCPLETISPADAAVARRIGERLAAVTRLAAEASGALLLDADSQSRAHTPCAAVPWSNGLSPGYDQTRGAPWHPNAAGHTAIADLLHRLVT